MVTREQLQKIQYTLTDARLIVEKLDLVAVEDGEISKDELELIEVIDKTCKQYSTYLESVLTGETITEAQMKKLRDYEQTLNTQIMDQVYKDGELSRPEQDVLNVLFDCLKNLKHTS